MKSAYLDQVSRDGRKRIRVKRNPNSVHYPEDIVCQILSRLPMEGLARSRCVCKSWYELTTTPHFISMQKDVAFNHPPRVVLLGRGNKPSLFLIGRSEPNFICKEIPIDIPALQKSEGILGSSNGLLCIGPTSCNTKQSHKLYIYNPITRECQKLPDHEFDVSESMFLYGFAFDSVNKKYKVICVYEAYCSHTDDFGDDHIQCLVTRGGIITLGEDSWRELDIPYRILFGNWSQTVLLDGAFHWMIQRDSRSSEPEKILSFNIDSEEFHTINVPPCVKLPSQCTSPLRLINFSDSLTIVESDKYHNLFRLWKLVGSETHEIICQLPPGTCQKYHCEVQWMLEDSSFLFQATSTIRMQNTKVRERDHLAVGDPQKNYFGVIKMQGAPNNFRVHLFVPTLVSPITICSAGEEECSV